MPRSVDDLPWLAPGDRFPAPEQALDEPNGLLAIGGDLSSATLLAAYRAGIFPWFSDQQPILWWSPNPRMVLFPEQLHQSRSLKKRLRSTPFRFSIDQAFEQVIHACAADRDADGGTWITDGMRDAYIGLHHLGYAHSVEVWLDDQLCGGLYGISLGNAFFGESMFSRRSDASKAALVLLCRLSQPLRLGLIDCQVSNPHLASLGATEIPRSQFLSLIRAMPADANNLHWPHPPAPLAQYLHDYRLEQTDWNRRSDAKP